MPSFCKGEELEALEAETNSARRREHCHGRPAGFAGFAGFVDVELPHHLRNCLGSFGGRRRTKSVALNKNKPRAQHN